MNAFNARIVILQKIYDSLYTDKQQLAFLPRRPISCWSWWQEESRAYIFQYFCMKAPRHARRCMIEVYSSIVLVVSRLMPGFLFASQNSTMWQVKTRLILCSSIITISFLSSILLLYICNSENIATIRNIYIMGTACAYKDEFSFNINCLQYTYRTEC